MNLSWCACVIIVQLVCLLAQAFVVFTFSCCLLLYHIFMGDFDTQRPNEKGCQTRIGSTISRASVIIHDTLVAVEIGWVFPSSSWPKEADGKIVRLDSGVVFLLLPFTVICFYLVMCHKVGHTSVTPWKMKKFHHFSDIRGLCHNFKITNSRIVNLYIFWKLNV